MLTRILLLVLGISSYLTVYAQENTDGITAFVLKCRLVPTGEDPIGEFRKKGFL